MGTYDHTYNGSASKPNSAGTAHDVKNEMDELAQDAKSEFEAVKSAAQDDLNDLQHEAQRQFDNTRRAAGQFAEDQKNHAARQLGDFGSALEKTSAELEKSGQPQVANYTRDIGQGIANFSKNIENQSTSDIIHSVERFARQQPVVFLGLAAAMGLAASRFLSASKPRQPEPVTPTAPAQPRQSATDGTTSYANSMGGQND